MADEIRVLMVEDEQEICEQYRALAQQQEGLDIVYDTGSEQKALNYLRRHPIDVMILDLELTEGDGISLLDAIQEEKLQKPFIIVVTNTVSKVTLSYVRTHGADYIYQKINAGYSPHHVLRLIEKLYPYNCYAEPFEDNRPELLQIKWELNQAVLRRNVQTELEHMGFSHKVNGFEYLLDAILLCVNHKQRDVYVTSEIYPEIAEKWHTTQMRVERAIRWSIERAFRKANIHRLHQHYPFQYDADKGRPSNSQFILNMASKFEEPMD